MLTDTHLKALKCKVIFFQEAKFTHILDQRPGGLNRQKSPAWRNSCALRREKSQAQGAATPGRGLCCCEAQRGFHTPARWDRSVPYHSFYAAWQVLKKRTRSQDSPRAAHRDCSAMQSSQHNPACSGSCFTAALLLEYSADTQQPGWFSQLLHYLVAKDFLKLRRDLSEVTNT